MIEARGLEINAYELMHFRLDGDDIFPVKKGSDMVFDFEMDEKTHAIEYRYRALLTTDKFWRIILSRFVKEFRFSFAEDTSLCYEYTPLGGLPQPRLREGADGRKSMRSQSMCFPYQGILVEWFFGCESV